MRLKRLLILLVIFIGGYYLTTWVLGRFGGSSDFFSDSSSVSSSQITPLHNEARNVVLIQSYILEGTYQASQTNDHDDSTLGQINAIDELLHTDMVSLLEEAPSKATALQQYIAGSDQRLTDTQGHVLAMEQQRQDIAYQRTQCQQSKAVADNTFFRGLNQNDTNDLEQGLADAKEYGACDVQLRIEYNALGALITKIQKKRSLLTQKRDLLIANQDLIVENFIYFSDQQLTLETLAQLRIQLEKIERANSLLQ